MTWLRHQCHFCGLKHKDVDFIVGDRHYQCKFELWDECHARRDALPDYERTYLGITGRLPK